MKREKVVIPRRFWYWRISLLALVTHILVYAGVWLAAVWRGMEIERLTTIDLTNVSNYVSVFQNQILLALFWLPFLIIHVGAHLYFAGRSNGGVSERQAYREGFRDGAQHSTDNGYDSSRLMLDEDGELVEMVSGEKRKRGEQ